MNNIIGMALLVCGAVLLGFGFDARNSFSSDVSRLVDGAPSDKSLWLLGIGAALAVAGAATLIRPKIGRAAD